MLMAFFQETAVPKKSSARWTQFNFQAVKRVIAHPAVLRISAILLLSQVSWSLYYQFIPPVLKTTLGFNAHALGLFVGLVAFWLALATSFGIKFLDMFFSLNEMLICALYLFLVGLILSAVFCFLHVTGASSIAIWLAAIPTAVGDVIAYSCLITLYSDVVEKEDQGKVMGMCFVVVALIWSLAGLFGGVMMSSYELLPLLVAPAGIIFSIILLHFGFLRKI